MTPSSSTQEQQLVIPAELKPADGRFGCGPSKVRLEALARLASDGAAVMGTSHRQAAGARRSSARSVPACASCSRCPTAMRSRSATAARPPSGTPPPSGWSASARCISSSASSRRSSRPSTAGAPFLAEPIVVEAEPGDAPDPASIGAQAAEAGADVIAWAHNETSTGVMIAGAPAEWRRRRARR